MCSILDAHATRSLSLRALYVLSKMATGVNAGTIAQDGGAPPPLPADDEPSKEKAVAVDTAAAHNAVPVQTPLPTSTLPAASQAQPSSSSSSPIAASLASVEQKGTLTALPQPQLAAAADLVAAQINSRVAAAASAQPAKASAAPSAAGAPLLARPPPGAAPLWPGYYHPTLPFPYPYQPYHYAPYPAAFLPPPWAAPRPAMPAAVPSSSAAGGVPSPAMSECVTLQVSSYPRRMAHQVAIRVRKEHR